MKIAWVQDSSENHNDLVSIGERLGFDIVGITQQDFTAYVFPEADLIILNKLSNFTEDQLYKIKYAIFELRKPYSVIIYDLSELKRMLFSVPLFSQSQLNIFTSMEQLKIYKDELGACGMYLPLKNNKDFYKFWKEISKQYAGC
jgi:hypothetical protein